MPEVLPGIPQSSRQFASLKLAAVVVAPKILPLIELQALGQRSVCQSSQQTGKENRRFREWRTETPLVLCLLQEACVPKPSNVLKVLLRLDRVPAPEYDVLAFLENEIVRMRRIVGYLLTRLLHFGNDSRIHPHILVVEFMLLTNFGIQLGPHPEARVQRTSQCFGYTIIACSGTAALSSAEV